MPIPGTRSPKRIEENTAAADLTLTDTDLKAIDEILPQGASAPAMPGDTCPPGSEMRPGTDATQVSSGGISAGRRAGGERC